MCLCVLRRKNIFFSKAFSTRRSKRVKEISKAVQFSHEAAHDVKEKGNIKNMQRVLPLMTRRDED